MWIFESSWHDNKHPTETMWRDARRFGFFYYIFSNISMKFIIVWWRKLVWNGFGEVSSQQITFPSSFCWLFPLHNRLKKRDISFFIFVDFTFYSLAATQHRYAKLLMVDGDFLAVKLLMECIWYHWKHHWKLKDQHWCVVRLYWWHGLQHLATMANIWNIYSLNELEFFTLW